MPSPLSGQVQTVLGSIGADEIGVTLPHEHLLIDFEVMFVEPTASRDRERSREPVRLANLGWVRQNFNANLDNLRLVDGQIAQDEILLFKDAGGRTVVDPTPRTLARDPLALARIARATRGRPWRSPSSSRRKAATSGAPSCATSAGPSPTSAP